MTRFCTVVAVLLIVTFLLIGCGHRASETPTVIAVTIRPLALIAQAIAGPELTIVTLGDEMGNMKQDARNLAADSAVVFRTGVGVDAWSENITGKTVPLIDLSSVLEPGMTDGAWLSFGRAVAMSRLIRDTLDMTYPSYKERFDARYASLVEECSRADGRLKQLIWKASNRAFVAADTTWSDAARDYGLRIVVQSALKTLDLGSTDAAATITAWGAAEATHVAILDLSPEGSLGIDQRIKGAVVCYLDAMGKTASDSFVSWLEGQLTLLGSALGM